MGGSSRARGISPTVPWSMSSRISSSHWVSGMAIQGNSPPQVVPPSPSQNTSRSLATSRTPGKSSLGATGPPVSLIFTWTVLWPCRAGVNWSSRMRTTRRWRTGPVAAFSPMWTTRSVARGVSIRVWSIKAGSARSTGSLPSKSARALTTRPVCWKWPPTACSPCREISTAHWAT